MEKFSLRERKREAVTQAIFRVTERIWLNEGRDAVAMAAIAKQAGIAVGTLYNYFADKETLLTELVKSRVNEIKKFANSQLELKKDASVQEQFRLILEISYGLRKEVLEARQFLITAYRGENILSDLSRVGELGYVDVLKPVIQRAQAHGNLQHMDYNIAAAVLVGVALAVHGQFLLSSITAEKAIELTIDAAMKGLGRD